MATANILSIKNQGIVAYDGTVTYNGRTLTAGSAKMSITNGNGVSGNPTIDAVEAQFNLNNIGGTLNVNKGGTGLTSATAYAVLAGGTTTTNPFQSISGTGTSGQVLTSNGAGALPTWQNAPGGFVPNLTYIGSTTTNSGSAANYTNLSSTYKGYRFYFEGSDPSGSDNLIVQLSTDGGSTYDATTANYVQTGTNLTFKGLWTGFELSSGAQSGYVDIFFNNTANATVTLHRYAFTASSSNGNPSYYVPLSNVNALRFVWEAGSTFTAGTIVQYGIS